MPDNLYCDQTTPWQGVYFFTNTVYRENDTNSRIMTLQWVSHTAITLTVLVIKYTPCQGVVWSQYRLPGTLYVPLGFGVVLFAKVCVFLPMQFWKAVDFTLALLYLNFKLQYLMNSNCSYSSDFNNFCRFWLHYCSDQKPKVWGPNFIVLFQV